VEGVRVQLVLFPGAGAATGGADAIVPVVEGEGGIVARDQLAGVARLI